MLLISHRGNIKGPVEDEENKPPYIDAAIKEGYIVEIDLFAKGSDLWLGHDNPQYSVGLEWLKERNKSLLVHCKNLDVLTLMGGTNIPAFFHKTEDYALLTNGLIWAHTLTPVNDNCIIPLLTEEELLGFDPTTQAVAGICSDYIDLINEDRNNYNW